MSELSDVTGGQIIGAAFTNQVKERTAMRYASAAARDASVPIPVEGALAYLQDVRTLTMWAGPYGWLDIGGVDPGEGLQTIAPQNNWIEIYTTIAVWKEAGGSVHLQGSIHSGTGLFVGTVPDGWRPATDINFTVHAGMTGAPYRLQVTASGFIQFIDSWPQVGQEFFVDFSGFSWYSS